MMRIFLIAAVLVGLSAPALALETRLEGAVTGGGFGMTGSDYYGDARTRMPFTQEAAPRSIGIADVERVRTARRHAEAASPRLAAHRTIANRRHPRG
ncbi:hypothetical protein [Methylobacterium sp. NEAU K]|uniref:hypothetical protein n=1 Tax=Methylobacterium sp. NEAU K TaxID=3064946 RepID=UPI00273591D1|nr:hypothetical protein [Methylobacterium sp. NEAU K]MDP4006955.1 hypothetical protein [Methylobacterium sp. NEAU K]